MKEYHWNTREDRKGDAALLLRMTEDPEHYHYFIVL